MFINLTRLFHEVSKAAFLRSVHLISSLDDNAEPPDEITSIGNILEIDLLLSKIPDIVVEVSGDETYVSDNIFNVS